MMGQLGLELAREHRPDLIMLDMHLPDLSGEQVLGRLREQEETRTIPAVVLNADAIDATRTPAVDELADGFITKPIGVQALLDLVDRFRSARRVVGRAHDRFTGRRPQHPCLRSGLADI